MKAFLSVKFHDDLGNRPHIEALASALEAAGVECLCIARDVELWGEAPLAPRDLMRRTCAEILKCDLLVADLAEKGVGVGLEAGYAHARDIPVVTVAPEDADVSETLAGISFRLYRYTRPADLVAPLHHLAQALDALAGSVDARRTTAPPRPSERDAAA